MSVSDLSSSLIKEGLTTSFIGQNIVYLSQVSSTMDVAQHKALKGVAAGTVIITNEQTIGRGRMRRTWFSPQGNIALSIILYPDNSFLPFLVMIASLAVVRGIELGTGLKTQIKWPNDVLIKGKKVCGILIENKMKGNSLAHSIVGIGINVSWRPSDTNDITFPSTSLEEETSRSVSRADVVRSVLTEFERLYLELPAGESIYTMWKDRLITLGKRVTVIAGNDIFEGIAESVDSKGTLLLRSDKGKTTRIVAGDVTLRDSHKDTAR